MATTESFVRYQRRKRSKPESELEEDHPTTVPNFEPFSTNIASHSSEAQTANCEEDQEKRSANSWPPNQNGKQKQFFLDFGQANFSYTTCKLCGMFYALGHDEDEKLHSTLHKSFLTGIQFKGWQKERTVVSYEESDERVIVVFNSDPPQHQLKVKEVIRTMEKELDLQPGWLLHDLCKVYLYISLKRLVGCAVVESISKAYPVLVESQKENDARKKMCTNKTSSSMVFGNITFKREIVKKKIKSESILKQGVPIVCSKVAVNAVCGIRGLWVCRSERKKGIATKLMDGIRNSFVYGCVVDPSQCAFSQPTSDGQAFASKYCKTDKFLVYS